MIIMIIVLFVAVAILELLALIWTFKQKCQCAPDWARWYIITWLTYTLISTIVFAAIVAPGSVLSHHLMILPDVDYRLIRLRIQIDK